eukprot:GHVS01007718.1.p1 GENE.GHVS01007718.1~~GHVS01007718.1.p1  ORF type:complete len:201 (+),score=23.64 GHVS01007718.1:384-986(+)
MATTSLYYLCLLSLLAWTSAAQGDEGVGASPRRNLLGSYSSSDSRSEGSSSSGESQTTSSSSGESLYTRSNWESHSSSSSSEDGYCSGRTLDCASYREDYICASNGVSYASYCALLNEQAKDVSIFMVYPGKCDKKGTCSYMCPNLFTNHFIPEFHCGSDGLTYSSLCDLQQKGCEDQTINRLLHPGACNSKGGETLTTA